MGGWPDDHQLPTLSRAVQPAHPPHALTDTLPHEWSALLAAELHSDWYAQLLARVAQDRARSNVYPPADQVFTAFRLTPLSKLRVLLLGQDPYHGAGQAHGLAFSVP